MFRKLENKIKTIVLAALLSFAPVVNALAETVLNGAGATFPYPIYSKWFDEYHKIHPDIQINYQSIGSGGGIRQITSKTVDFGATDGPMTDKQLFEVDGKIIHIPTVLGSVVPTFNLPDVTELNLSGDVLAGIFLGKIKKWSDPAIVSLNPTAKLPDSPITVIHRSDGSGTTYCWVDYLCKVSPEWEKKVGRGTSVNWPAGLGGKGNEGVAGLVKQTRGSIGYTELAYAVQNNLSYAAVKNKAGKFVKADLKSITAAAAGVPMPKDYRVSVTNASGADSYPISSFTWLLVYEKNSSKVAPVLRDFLAWMLSDGQKMAVDLGYAPLPDVVKDMVAQTIKTIK